MAKEALQTLGLAPASRRLPNLTGYTTDLNPEGLRQTPVDYLDYTVDGHPLYGLIAQQIGDIDLVSPLQDHWPELAIDAIPRLLGEAPPDLPDGRTSLYVCPECASLGCGAITAEIFFTADMVTWRHFGTQDENNKRVEQLTIPGAPEMHFAREPYVDLFTRELVRYQQLLRDAKIERANQRRDSRRRRLRSLGRLLGRT
ncbi:hypothetical protein [Knoellia sp. p5-6-4]|uniref:hypothetical protein n=1 Tax=unclassified Knoellia TaxID=2618719 RepID=UPI0023DC5BEC|nr:hypothetical protein [Knoellia sp. p5-6-4]MDF2146952.1 hypothetical protein [Knoellia sp. p5-6-4]